MLNAVANVAKVFVDVCNSGCLFFKEWKSLFYCNDDKRVHISIGCGDGSEEVLISTQSIPTLVMHHVYAGLSPGPGRRMVGVKDALSSFGFLFI
jgi:hypothetical protein